MRRNRRTPAPRQKCIFSIFRGRLNFFLRKAGQRPPCQFKIQWMDDRQPDPSPAPSEPARSPLESAVEAIVGNIDLAKIPDERARQCIVQLLNLVEKLAGELRKAQAE